MARYSNPSSSGLIGWLVVGFGGYLVLKYMGIDPLAMITGGTPSTPLPVGTTSNPVVTTNPNPTTAGSTTTTTTNTTNLPPTTPSTLQQIINMMNHYADDPTAYHSVDEYNYYYQMVRGIAGPGHEVLFPGNNDPNDTMKYSISEWWNAMSHAGFNGLAGVPDYYGMSGLGVITRSNPYGPGQGRGAVLLGSETMIKYLN